MQPCGLASSSFSSLLSLLLENIPLPSGKYYVLKGSGVRFMSLLVTHRHFRLQTNLAIYRREDEVCQKKNICNAIGHLATLSQRNCGRNCSSLESFLRSKSKFGVTDRRKKRKNDCNFQFTLFATRVKNFFLRL